MPPGVLFAVYDSKTGNPDYIPPEYCDIPGLLDELVEYVNTTDDHPLIVALSISDNTSVRRRQWQNSKTVIRLYYGLERLRI